MSREGTIGWLALVSLVSLVTLLTLVALDCVVAVILTLFASEIRANAAMHASFEFDWSAFQVKSEPQALGDACGRGFVFVLLSNTLVALNLILSPILVATGS